MLINLSLLFTFLFLRVTSTQKVKETLRSVGHVKDIPVNFLALREAERNSKEATFLHGKEFLNALSIGQKFFEVFENKSRDIGLLKLNDYDEMMKTFVYDTHTSYTLASHPTSYINLDNKKHLISFGLITEFSAKHITQCGHQSQTPEGTFLVGSSRGAWAELSSISVKHGLKASLAHLHRPHLEERNDKGLLLLRRVVTSERIDSEGMEGCSKLHTESIHPLELFEKMRIETIGESPFQHTSKERTVENEEEVEHNYSAAELPSYERKTLSSIVQPDAPVVTCDTTGDSNLGSGWLFYGTSEDWSYQFGKTSGCAEYSKDLPGSFNFNYDYSTGNASTMSYDLGGGINCVDCYAFLGAGLMVIVQYHFGYFEFEAKVGGGLGFSVNINALNPSLSTSKVVTLIEGDSSFGSSSFGKGGLQLGMKRGALTATLSGSGSAAGKISFGAAESFSGSMAILYVSGSDNLTFPSTSFAKSVPPYLSSSLTQVSLSVGLTLTGTEYFFLTYSGYISYYFSSNLAASVSYTVGFGTTGLVSIINTPERRLLSESFAKAYLPGDVISIRFEYSGFNPLEETSLFYAISKSGNEHPIMQRNITTSSTGSGVFDTTWTVPWDLSLAGEGPNNTQIIVRGSNFLYDTYKSPKFETTLFTETDGIFTAPYISETVPTDTPYTIRWNAKLLAYFKPVLWGSHLGSEVPATNVTFEVVGEKISTNGTVILSSFSYYGLTSKPVLNSGKCTVSFPSNLTDSGDRFYIIVKSLKNGQSSGWSKSYFMLISSRADSFATRSNVVLLSSKTKNTASKQERNNLLAESSRLLDGTGCSGTQSSITYGLNAGLDSQYLKTKASSYPVDMSSYHAGFPLLAATTACISTPTPSPTLAPTPSPTLAPTPSPTPSPTLAPTPSPTLAPTPAPTPSPILAPTPSPTLAPTFAPTPSPTPSPTPLPSLSPTSRPTIPVMTVLLVTEVFTGINATVIQSAVFKAALQTSIATSVGFLPSAVNIVSVDATTTRMRTLLGIGASVQYTITAPNVNPSTLTTMLKIAISSGVLTSKISASDPSLAGVTANAAPFVVDISPTAVPTSKPSIPPSLAPVSGVPNHGCHHRYCPWGLAIAMHLFGSLYLYL